MRKVIKLQDFQSKSWDLTLKRNFRSIILKISFYFSRGNEFNKIIKLKSEKVYSMHGMWCNTYLTIFFLRNCKA